MPIVFDNIELPGTTFDVLARVDVYLVANEDDLTVPGVIAGSDVSILDKQSDYSNGAGYVQFNLRANSLITPGGTYYVWETHFKDGRVSKRYISVPNGAGPYHVADIETSVAPPVPSTSTLGIRYAAPWGDDSNDGTSWGAPKLHVMVAYDSLPAGGGTVYFADGTNATATAGEGIWVTGPSDPNYSSLPAGWRKAKGAPQFIGVGGSLSSRRGPQAILHGGSNSDATKPAIAAFVQSGASFENIATDLTFRPIRVGMTSAGAPSTNFHQGTYWSNVQGRIGGGAGAGPNWTFESSGDTSFWHHAEWIDMQGNNAAAVTSEQRCVIVSTGTYLLTIQHAVWTYGGMKFTTPNVSWNLIVDDVQGECDFVNPMQPLVDLYGSQFAGYALLSNLDIYDAPGTPCIIRNPSLPAECVIVSGLGTAGVQALKGRHTQLGFERVTAASLGARRSYGPQRWRDIGRRMFGLSATQRDVVQLANHAPTAWVGRSHGLYGVGGNATVTAATAPNGVPNQAGLLTFTSTGTGTREVNADRTLAVGDFLVFAVWAERKTTGTDSSVGPSFAVTTTGFAVSTDILNELGAAGTQFPDTTPQTFGPFDRPSPTFYQSVVRVTAIGTNPCHVVGELNVDQNGSILYFAPQLYHFPASAWNAEEVASFANAMGTIPYMPNLFHDGDAYGVVTTQFGQRLMLPGGTLVVADQDTAAGGIYGVPAGSGVFYKHNAGHFISLAAAGVNAWNLVMRSQAATGDRLSIQNGSTRMELSNDAADTETEMLLMRNVGGTKTLQRVSMGAADSGGTGFKSLRVPN